MIVVSFFDQMAGATYADVKKLQTKIKMINTALINNSVPCRSNSTLNTTGIGGSPTPLSNEKEGHTEGSGVNQGGKLMRKNYELRKVSLSALQEEFLIGSLLGDGSLVKGKPHWACHYACSHKEPQLEYLQWKYDLLRPIAKTGIWERELKGKSYYCFGTVCNSNLESFFKLFYPKGKKVISEEIMNKLTPLGLSVWYMDDGSWHKGSKRARIITGAPITEVEVMQKSLKDKFGLNASLQYAKNPNFGTHHLWISNTDDFISIIGKYVLPCVRYKIGEAPVETKRCAPCESKDDAIVPSCGMTVS